MILFVSVALAGSFVVVLREDESAFSGAIPRLTLTDGGGTTAQLDLNDQGTAPDVTAGDHTWTGLADLGEGQLTLLLTDGGDMRVWKGAFTPTAGAPPALALGVAPEGEIAQLDPAALVFGTTASTPGGAPSEGTPTGSPPPAGTGEAAPGDPNGATPAPEGATAGASAGGPQPQPEPKAETNADALDADPFRAFGDAGRVGAWALVVAALVWVLAGARRFSPAAVEPLPGPVPTLEGRGLVTMDGDWAAFVRTLAGPFRVLLVGESDPGEVPGGTVFVIGGARVAIEDVLGVLDHLDRTGPPVVVVLVGDVVGPGGSTGDAALAALARRLPPEAVVYVFPARGRRIADFVVS